MQSIMASLIASGIKHMWVQLNLPLLYFFSTQQVASVIFFCNTTVRIMLYDTIHCHY
jgi:hypothetical protein